MWINDNRFNNKNHVYFLGMGNLMFFPKTNMEKLAQQRFFFFNTLLSDYSKLDQEPWSSAYRTFANDLGNAAVSVLGNSPLINNENLEETIFFERMKQAQKILQQGIIYEQNNELKYIQNKMNDFNQIFNENDLNNSDLKTIKTLFSKLNTENGIDYKALINLINILTQGLKQTKAIYKENKKHIETVNNSYQEAKEKYLNQIAGLNKSKKNKTNNPASSERLSQRFDRQASKIYLNNKNLKQKRPDTQIGKILKSHMNDIQNIDSKIAEFVTQSIKEVLYSKNFFSVIKATIDLESILKAKTAPSEEEIKHAIVSAALKLASKNIDQILEHTIDYETMAQEISNYVIDQKDEIFNLQIEGYYDNFGFLGKQLKFFKTIDNEKISAEDLYTAVEELVKLASNKDSKLNLTEEQKQTQQLLLEKGNPFIKYIKLIHQIESYAKQIKKEQEVFEPLILELDSKKNEKQKINIVLIADKDGKLKVDGNLTDAAIIGDKNFLDFKTFKPTTLQGMINTLKSRSSQKIKERLLSIIKTSSSKKIKEQVTYNLKQGLENIRVSIGGPKWSEILVQIQAGLKDGKLQTGSLNLKNDNIIISCYFDNDFKTDFSFNSKDITQLSEGAQEELNSLRDSYIKDYTQAIQQDLKEFSKNKAYNQYKEYEKRFFQQEDKRQEYIETTKNQLQILDNMFKNNQIDETEYIKQKDAQIAFLNELKNTLYISSTSKTYNNYMNDIGFVGGSIGSTIMEQIDHLNEIFSNAGMGLTQEERDWLIFAAINNSSLSVIGHQNESIIENYLGSLATFALFSEGAAEVTILKNIEDTKNKEQLSNPNILHLYFVNGTYYPGSYVLQQAYDHINFILDNMETTLQHSSQSFQNGIKITNSVNFKDIPNNEGYKRKQQQYNTRPWQTVSKTAERKTNLHILFLAGLLSVVDGLMEQLDRIQLPQ